MLEPIHHTGRREGTALLSRTAAMLAELECPLGKLEVFGRRSFGEPSIRSGRSRLNRGLIIALTRTDSIPRAIVIRAAC